MNAANDTNPSNYRYTTANPGHMQLELLRPLLQCVESRAPTTVLDVGSGNGYLSSQVHAKFPQCQIHGLEPGSAWVEIA